MIGIFYYNVHNNIIIPALTINIIMVVRKTNAVFKGTVIGRFYYNVLLLSTSDPMDYTNTSGLLLMLYTWI